MSIHAAHGHFSSAIAFRTIRYKLPGLGATPFGYQIAEQFGIHVIAPRASLVPLLGVNAISFMRRYPVFP